jgi:hypothetical protein
VDTLVPVFRDVCQLAVELDGLVYAVETVAGQPIKEDADYSGVRITFQASLENARVPMQIDIGFENRKTVMSAVPIALTAAVANDPIKQTQWKGFARKSRLAIAPADFPEVVAALGNFLGPLAVAITTGQEFALNWHPSGMWQ